MLVLYEKIPKHNDYCIRVRVWKDTDNKLWCHATVYLDNKIVHDPSGPIHADWGKQIQIYYINLYRLKKWAWNNPDKLVQRAEFV